MSEFLNGHEIPHYTSHKVVQALEIKHVEVVAGAKEYVVVFADEKFGVLSVDAKVFERHSAKFGDWLVFYEDGHRSVSPKHAFDTGYTKNSA